MLSTARATFLAIMAVAAVESPALAQGSAGKQSGIFGDDFAREAGTIVVRGERDLGRDLFEKVDIPESSCLAAAPEVGADAPGFLIDASGMRKVKDLEKIRRKTNAGTIFVSGGNFMGQKLGKAKLYDMCFFNTDFSQTDWTGFSGSGMGFVGANLNGAQMASTTMPYVLFRSTNLAETDARMADWSYGQIDGGWDGNVRNLNLAAANLTGFQVDCGTSAEDGCPTERRGLTLAGANLRRASFYSFYWPEIDLTDATIDQTELSLDHLPYTDTAKVIGPIVLRSRHRAMMLFPMEAKQLASAEGAAQEAEPCGEEPVGALAVLCNVPGSDAQGLLKSVRQLEVAASSSRNYGERRTTWLATRDGCMEIAEEDTQITCVLSAYRAREAELRAVAGAPNWLTEPGYRLFLSSEAAFATSSGDTGLYGRVLPIMLDTAVAAVIVKVDERGKISARGMTQDGCGFDASNLRYDFDANQLELPSPRRRQAGERLLSFSGGDIAVAAEGLEKLDSCARDADFPRLAPLALGEELLRDIYDRF